jgi:hypothetical protein
MVRNRRRRSDRKLGRPGTIAAHRLVARRVDPQRESTQTAVHSAHYSVEILILQVRRTFFSMNGRHALFNAQVIIARPSYAIVLVVVATKHALPARTWTLQMQGLYCPVLA